MLCYDIHTRVWHSRSIHRQNHVITHARVFTSNGYLALGLVHPDCHMHSCRNKEQLGIVCGLGCTQRRVFTASCWYCDG